jgi:hypothetical protein
MTKARIRHQLEINSTKAALKERTMRKVTIFIAIGTSLIVGATSAPAFAFTQRALAAGERDAHHLLRLMDKDQNGRVSKQEFMQFMEAEFDRMDADRSGELTADELERSQLHYRTSITAPRR